MEDAEKARQNARKWRKNNREKHRKYSRDYYKDHPEQYKANALEWARNNPEKRKEIYTKSQKKHPESRLIHHLNRYSLTLEQYNKLLIEQNGFCKICGSPPNGKRLFVDHDHKIGKVRGLLCHFCNMGLGGFKDDTRNLRLAVEYLEKS